MAPFALSAAAAAVAFPHEFAAWTAFKAKFSKTYTSDEEHELRFKVFLSNLQHIEAENAKGFSYRLGVNQFSDMTPQEYRQHLGFKRPAKFLGTAPRFGIHAYTGEALADAVDWAENGAVTPVKNQGSCGSCWAFSTTGSLEGAWQIASGKLVSVSEQQLIDCNKENDGCSGGTMDPAFTWLQTVSACTEESYPYEQEAAMCKSGCDAAIPKGGVTGYKDVEPSEEAHMSALMLGPISVAIQADQAAFQQYESGVLTASCGSDLDHGVLAVGYGSADDGTKYWKIKNSWGSQWGERGYIRILRGQGGAGQCGILSMSSYPVVDTSASPAPPSPASPMPAPMPAPVPTPAPPPTPTPGSDDILQCILAWSQEKCGASAKNGDPCKWCAFGIRNFGLCMNPDFKCPDIAAQVLV